MLSVNHYIRPAALKPAGLNNKVGFWHLSALQNNQT